MMVKASLAVAIPFLAASVVAKPTSTLSKRNNDKPNFVYIITDEDAALAHPEFMPLLHKYIGSQGVNYTNFFTPISQCCPSRVGFMRGQLAHTHNITYVQAPYGGYDLFDSFGYNGDSLFSWLQDVGYQTYYTGKLMNGNSAANAESVPVLGLNRSSILLDPYTYSYINSSYTIDNGPPKHYPGDYSTDRIRDFGLDYIEEIAKHDEPFFLGIAPIGPHSTGPLPRQWVPAIPAERHANLFNDAIVPRSESFNPDSPSGVSWVRNLAKLNSTVVDYLDDFYRNRIRSVQSIDELVEATVQKLEKLGLMDNTYIMYTSDNGYTVGEHRRPPGKTTGYEEDIRVPFVIRGPGIKPGEDRLSAHANIDITATMLHLAKAGPVTFEIDGRVMPWGDKGASKKELGTVSHQLSEFWLIHETEGKWANFNNTLFTTNGTAPTNNNTYRTLRVIEENQNWAYAVWCTGERELYNMNTDSLQMHNQLEGLNAKGSFAEIDATDAEGRLASRLDALMLYLKYCKGTGCRFSWINIFPGGEAKSLEEAMDPKFDEYFNSLPKVHYKDCSIGFHLENEFPYWTTNMPYSKNLEYGDGSKTSDESGGKRLKARDYRMVAWYDVMSTE